MLNHPDSRKILWIGGFCTLAEVGERECVWNVQILHDINIQLRRINTNAYTFFSTARADGRSIGFPEQLSRELGH